MSPQRLKPQRRRAGPGPAARSAKDRISDLLGPGPAPELPPPAGAKAKAPIGGPTAPAPTQSPLPWPAHRPRPQAPGPAAPDADRTNGAPRRISTIAAQARGWPEP